MKTIVVKEGDHVFRWAGGTFVAVWKADRADEQMPDDMIEFPHKIKRIHGNEADVVRVAVSYLRGIRVTGMSREDLEQDLDVWCTGDTLPTPAEWRDWLYATTGTHPTPAAMITLAHGDPPATMAVWNLHEYGWPVVAVSTGADVDLPVGHPQRDTIGAVFAFANLEEAVIAMGTEMASLLPADKDE